MSYYLWLDDTRPVPYKDDKWKIAKSLEEFKDTIIKYGMPEFISFDHDLNIYHYGKDYTDRKTGVEAIDWLMEYVKQVQCKDPHWNVHTMNEDRKPMMFSKLDHKWPKGRISSPIVLPDFLENVKD